MTPLPTSTQKPKGRTTPKKPPARSWRWSILRFLLLVALLAATLSAAVYLIFVGHEPRAMGPAKEQSRFQSPARTDGSAKKSPSAPTSPAVVIPRQEESETTPDDATSPAPDTDYAIPTPATPAAPPEPGSFQLPAGSLPRVAIMIDDMGYQKAICEGLLALDIPLTFAFLPHAPHTRPLVEEAARLGRDILLHQPLEPQDQQWKLGPGAITLDMTGDQMAAVLAGNLADVKLAIGVNNHMGSRFIENRAATRTLLQLIKNHNLFFVDSQTTSNTLGFPLAKEIGMPAASRDVFLDNEADEGAVSAQLAVLVDRAKRKGSAIGIGHPKPATLAALRRFAANRAPGVQVVGVRQLLR